MIRNDYGFEITHLDNLDMSENQKHNVWKDISFYYHQKPEKFKKLVVTFHGANNFKDGELMNTPLFRGYNWKVGDADILCLADKIQEIYRSDKLLLSWYLDTEKHQYWDKYIKIVESIIEQSEYEELVFIGTSGGGIPAYRMASYFHQTALISNPQIEINKYSYFTHYKKIIENNGDKIRYMNSLNFIQEYNKQPKKMTYLCNSYDSHHIEKHSKPFVQQLIMESNIDFRLIYFDDFSENNKSPHLIYAPKHKTILNYI